MDEAARVHPESWWWIKADGCDLVSGLGESVRGEWNGDVDLNDGAISHLYNEYQQHLDFVTSIGGEKRSDHVSLKNDLCRLKQHMAEDIEFVTKSKQFLHV